MMKSFSLHSHKGITPILAVLFIMAVVVLGGITLVFLVDDIGNKAHSIPENLQQIIQMRVWLS